MPTTTHSARPTLLDGCGANVMVPGTLFKRWWNFDTNDSCFRNVTIFVRPRRWDSHPIYISTQRPNALFFDWVGLLVYKLCIRISALNYLLQPCLESLLLAWVKALFSCISNKAKHILLKKSQRVIALLSQAKFGFFPFSTIQALGLSF